ncbi:acetylxylan esterase [Agromyces sp. SYSU T00194]|uniref:acetylxylan esterase n=1 Tax=Agromyces chitinivorans TaxID=3158560 RepID=UPI0033987CF0
MPRFDLPENELHAYRPDVREPADFDAFWADTISEARAAGEGIRLDRVESPLETVDVFDLRFPGFGGHPIAGWVVAPRDRSGRLPAIVEYIGYTGGRSFPHEHLRWASSGYVHVIMDTRGQGSQGSMGITPDPVGSGPAVSGFVTRGIESPETYYYRRVFTDAVRAVDAARAIDFVDPEQVVVAGASQGGGITLAAAGLAGGLAAALPDIPFLTHFERAVGFTESTPYEEVAIYLRAHRDAVERAFTTLSYFDGVNFAKRATAPALFSTALMDVVCPPSTVFAAKNWYAGTAEIDVFPFNGHEGGGPSSWPRQAEWLARVLAVRGA